MLMFNLNNDTKLWTVWNSLLSHIYGQKVPVDSYFTIQDQNTIWYHLHLIYCTYVPMLEKIHLLIATQTTPFSSSKRYHHQIYSFTYLTQLLRRLQPRVLQLRGPSEGVESRQGCSLCCLAFAAVNYVQKGIAVIIGIATTVC